MIESISSALSELYNLRQVVEQHKEECRDECLISLHLLHKTATRLSHFVPQEEVEKAKELLKDWPV